MILCSVMLSCCKESPKKYNSPSSKAEKTESSSSSAVLTDVDGIILKKHENTYTNEYFFTIELSNGKVFDWETTRPKFVQKNEGDAVHFEYIRRDRFSDKALN